MENLLLVAESGIGKTMLLRKFQRDHAVPPDAASGVQRYPVVLTLMPEEPSEEAFYIQVLKAVGAPVVLTTRWHRLGMRETTFRLLRFLSNELWVAIVCAGVPEARFALLSDPQLRSRVADLALEPRTAGSELAAFVALLVQGMPLRQASPVDSSKLRRLLVERSGGITLSICRALERAAGAAIRTGKERINLPGLEVPEIWRGCRAEAERRGAASPRTAALA